MTAKTATVRCYVALAALITAILSLLGAGVRVVAASVALVAAAIEARAQARPRRDAPPARDTTSRPAPLRLVHPRPTEAVAPTGPKPPTAAGRLDSALRGLGFAPREVARVVGQLGPRVDHERIETLIPECLRALTPAALAG
jgi:hypothetical protein